MECNYCHKKGHYKANCPTLAAKAAGTTPNAAAPPASGKSKHWSKIPPSDTEPHTKTVTTDGKSAVFKWCKHCRRWRSGAKAHLSDQHRKKAAATQSGNTLQDASGGVNFGLFAGENASDAAVHPDFVLDFFASHSGDPTPSSEGALTADSVLRFSKAFVAEYNKLDNDPTWEALIPPITNTTFSPGVGDGPSGSLPFRPPPAQADQYRASKARCIASKCDDAPSNDETDPKAIAGQW